jgi:hypothetical protein
LLLAWSPESQRGAITMGVLLPDGVDLGHVRMVDGEL